MRSQEAEECRAVGIVAAWLSPCTGNSWGRVAGLGKAVVLFSAISLVGVEVGSDMAVCEDLWELLEEADGEGLLGRPEAPMSSALKGCGGSRLESFS